MATRRQRGSFARRLCCIMLLAACRAHSVPGSKSSDPPKRGPLAPSVAITEPAFLPCQRPPPYAGARSLADATVKVTKVPASGSLLIYIEHAPVKGVTPEMVAWMWRNLHKQVEDPRTKARVQMFMLAHPVDHAALTASTPDLKVVPTDPASSTRWTLSSFFGTGCSAAPAGAKPGALPPLSCPAAPAPLTCSSPAAALAKVPSMQAVPWVVKQATPNAFSYEALLGGEPALSSSFTYVPTSAGLSVRQALLLGSQGATPQANAATIPAIAAAAATGGDVMAAAALHALHEVQEVGFLPQWLPAVYAANKAALP